MIGLWHYIRLDANKHIIIMIKCSRDKRQHRHKQTFDEPYGMITRKLDLSRNIENARKHTNTIPN